MDSSNQTKHRLKEKEPVNIAGVWKSTDKGSRQVPNPSQRSQV